MIKNNKDLDAIKSAEKKGAHILIDQLNEFNSNMIVPSDLSLQESLNVLARGDANGGLREESSSVGETTGVILRGATGALPTVGSDGTASAPAGLPVVPKL